MMPACPTIRPPERLLDRYWRVACGAIVAQAKGRPVTEEAKQLARRALGKPATYKAAVTLIEAATGLRGPSAAGYLAELQGGVIDGPVLYSAHVVAFACRLAVKLLHEHGQIRRPGVLGQAARAWTSDFQRMMADDLIAERLGHRQPRTERADDQTIAAWMQQSQSIK
jgi:hypothetical protein